MNLTFPIASSSDAGGISVFLSFSLSSALPPCPSVRLSRVEEGENQAVKQTYLGARSVGGLPIDHS